MSRHSKTKRILNAFSGEVDVKVPRSWEELNQKELRYILLLVSQLRRTSEIMMLFFLRKAGMNPVKQVDETRWLMQCGRSQCYVNVLDLEGAVSESGQLGWMMSPPALPIRLHFVQGKPAVDARLRRVSFGDWLKLEHAHQNFLKYKTFSSLKLMAAILYPGVNQEKLDKVDMFNIVNWYSQVKVWFAKKWPHLFSGDGNADGYNAEDIANNMIRSLTGGDVLKEMAVLETIDVHRALNELDCKARENEELKAKMK